MQIDDMYVEHPRLFLGLLDICQMIILLQLLQYMIPQYVQITICEYLKKGDFCHTLKQGSR